MSVMEDLRIKDFETKLIAKGLTKYTGGYSKFHQYEWEFVVGPDVVKVTLYSKEFVVKLSRLSTKNNYNPWYIESASEAAMMTAILVKGLKEQVGV